jgi:hypothetical protein
MNRDGLGCGLLKDHSSGKTYVVAAGGFNGLVHLESVELLDLDQPDTWFGGPALPAALHNGRIVQVRNHIFSKFWFLFASILKILHVKHNRQADGLR